MFERFTDRAHKVVVLAGEEARKSGQKHIGTEHLLLGMLDEEEGIAAQALRSLAITPERVHPELLRIVPWSGGQRTEGQLPFTPRAERVLKLSLRESMRRSHKYIGTEHLLLGLIAENEGVALQILTALNVGPSQINEAVGRLISTPDAQILALHHGADVQMRGRINDWIRIAPSQPVRSLLMFAAARARESRRSEIEVRDLLIALARGPESTAALADFGVDVEAVREVTERQRAPQKPPEPSDEWVRVGPSEQVRRLLMAAGARALDRGRSEIEISDLLLAVTRDAASAAQVAGLGIDVGAVREAIERQHACEEPPEASVED